MKKEDLKKETLKFLSENVTAAVSTVSFEGEPEVATMYYYTDDNFNFYFITSKNSQKLKNIETNQKVAIVVGFGPTPITVQAGGIAEVSTDFKEELVNKVLEKINFYSVDQLPFLQLQKNGLVLLKVKPKWLVLLNFDKEGHLSTYNHNFHKLI